MASLIAAIKSGWNAFVSNELNAQPFGYGGGYPDLGMSTSFRPDRFRGRVTNERSIVTSIYNRIGIDVASVYLHHVRVDESGRYSEDIDSGLNTCLRVEANIDQAATMFRQDMVMSLLTEGVIAIVPVDTTMDPAMTGSFDIRSVRVGRVVQWYPRHVRINLYNDRMGRREDITLPKSFVGLVENPLYSVMNEPNSTLQRLVRKLSLIDTIDEQTGSGKLDLIIQLPYVIKSEGRRLQAEQRRKDLEVQLSGSKYGVAYTDGTEKVVQLNRPVDNNIMTQVTYLTQMLYGQLGLTEEIMNGTADEKTMLNYVNRTVEPLLRAMAEEIARKFLTKTARTQGQSIMYFRDPFKLVPMSDLAEIVDKLTRNEVATSNEIRQVIGWKPSKDPKADQLINSNMPTSDTGVGVPGDPAASTPADGTDPTGADPVATAAQIGFDTLNSHLDDIFQTLGVSDASQTN